MKRLLFRAMLLAAPFALLTTLVALVDPFNCLGYSTLVTDTVKFETAQPLHNPLWKLQKFNKAPVSRLILGDSSMASLNMQEIRAATGHEYMNLAYGGGTLVEAIDTYWFASARIHLDAVYMGVGLINFNEYQNLNRIPEAVAIAGSHARYLSNRIVVEAALLASYSALTGRRIDLGTPPMSRNAFWRYQIDEALPQLLHEYRYPTAIAAQLERVAADCRGRGTRFFIVIPPTQVELQGKIAALGRSADEARFKEFARSIATVYDLDYPNEFTAERANFLDPFHTVNDHMVIDEVWRNRQQYSRRTSPDSSATSSVPTAR